MLFDSSLNFEEPEKPVFEDLQPMKFSGAPESPSRGLGDLKMEDEVEELIECESETSMEAMKPLAVPVVRRQQQHQQKKKAVGRTRNQKMVVASEPRQRRHTEPTPDEKKRRNNEHQKMWRARHKMYVQDLEMDVCDKEEQICDKEEQIKKLEEENAMLRAIIAAAGIDEAAFIGPNPKAPAPGQHPTPPQSPECLPGCQAGEQSGPYLSNRYYFGPSFHPGPSF